MCSCAGAAPQVMAEARMQYQKEQKDAGKPAAGKPAAAATKKP